MHNSHDTSLRYNLGEEIANAVTHGVGALLSIVGLVVLLSFSAMYGDAWHIVSSSIYGFTLIVLYSASTLYHAIPVPDIKRILQKIDHAAIYLLIAGTYTPFTLINLRGYWGWSLFGVVWGLAIVGIVIELLLARRIQWLSLSLYLGMGWAILVAIVPMFESVETGGLILLLLGGLSYSLGVIFYVRDHRRYHHAIWHLFVLAGSTLHFFAVLLYAIT